MCLRVLAAAGPVPLVLISEPVSHSLVSGALKSVEASLAAVWALYCSTAASAPSAGGVTVSRQVGSFDGGRIVVRRLGGGVVPCVSVS